MESSDDVGEKNLYYNKKEYLKEIIISGSLQEEERCIDTKF